MDSPLEVSINTEEKINKDITHKYVITKAANKIPALRRFLDLQSDMRGILFCRTRWETQKISDDLNHMGYAVEALHGDLSQSQRDAVMKRFKTRSMQLLIATDVAARGIDVIDLTHVLHHTLPDQLDIYTHRSGRTARAGRKGTSIAFINPREGKRIAELERKIKVKFEHIEVPSVEELKSTRISNWANLIIKTKVDVRAEAILNDLDGQFAHLSKEDLLKRLITTQLDHLMVSNKESSNLNETHGESSNNNRRDKREGSGHRYFVNLGAIDGMTKGDLIHFLSDISGVDRKYFGQFSLQKNCAYFDVDKSHDNGLSEKFKGIEVEGRSVRVNKDDDGRPRSGGASFHGRGGRDRDKRNRSKKDFRQQSSRKRRR